MSSWAGQRAALVVLLVAALVVPVVGRGKAAASVTRDTASPGTIAFFRFPKRPDSRPLKRPRGSCRICGIYLVGGDGRKPRPVKHVSGRRLDLAFNVLGWS